MGFHVNAKSERYAYFSVFRHSWLPFLPWHVEIGAVLQNPIIKHLSYNVSAIHSWYWLLLSFQISHQAKTWTRRTTQPYSWLACLVFACDDQVTCMLLRTDSCAIDCTRGLLAEAAWMPRIATGTFYFLVHVFVRYGRYFCLCPSRFRAHVYVGTFLGHVSSPDALVRRPHVSAPEVLNKLVTTKQPYNILSWHVPPADVIVHPWPLDDAKNFNKPQQVFIASSDTLISHSCRLWWSLQIHCRASA